MTVRNAMTKMRAFLADLAGAALDMLRAVGRGLRRGWELVKPRAVVAWRVARPRLERAWTWLRAHGRSVALEFGQIRARIQRPRKARGARTLGRLARNRAHFGRAHRSRSSDARRT